MQSFLSGPRTPLAGIAFRGQPLGLFNGVDCSKSRARGRKCESSRLNFPPQASSVCVFRVMLNLRILQGLFRTILATAGSSEAI